MPINRLLSVTLFFSLIFTAPLSLDIGFTLKLYVIIVILLMLAGGRAIYFKFSTIICSILVLFLLTIALIDSSLFKAQVAFNFFIVFVFLLSIRSVNLDVKIIDRILLIFILANFIFFAYDALFFNFSSLEYNQRSNVFLLDRGALRFIGFNSDPNFAAITFSLLLVLCIRLKLKYHAVALGVLTLFTLSRGGLLALTPAFLVLYPIITTGLIFMLGVLFYFNYHWISELPGAAKRLDLGGGSGRTEKWELVLEKSNDAAFFGVRDGEYRDFAFQQLGSFTHAHNTVLDIFFNFGIFATTLFLALILSITGIRISIFNIALSILFFLNILLVSEFGAENFILMILAQHLLSIRPPKCKIL